MTLQDALNLAVQHHNAGRLEQAERQYRQILQQWPNQPETTHLFGVLMQQRGQVGLSVELIARAIAGKPAVGIFHSNLGEGLRRLGLLEEAEIATRRAIKLSPDFAAAHANLGLILSAKKQLPEAEQSLRTALQIDPSETNAVIGLSAVLKELGKADEAISLARRAVQMAPHDAITHNMLGAALESAGDLIAASVAYRKAIDLNPNFVEAIDNLGTNLYRQGNLPAGVLQWERALKISPGYPGSIWNLALAYLATGDWNRGWPLFENRLTIGPSRKYFREYPGIPQWDGFDLQGKTILVFPEQGYGDVIQFARFIPILADRGAKVILHVPAELIELMKRVPGIWKLVGPADEMPPFDTYRALMSLPMVLKITPANVPANIPYIHVDSKMMDIWRERFAPHAGKRKIGIVWAGRPTHRDDARRSIRLAHLSPLAEIGSIQLFSLQKGEAADQLREISFANRIVDLSGELNDFVDTAAAIANLDLVICVDTAVAHLAGALGKSVWTLLASAGDYRWMLDREDTPWYPTMKLYRQKSPNDWAGVIVRVVQDLDGNRMT